MELRIRQTYHEGVLPSPEQLEKYALCPLCSPWLKFLTTKAQRTQRFTEEKDQFLPVCGRAMATSCPSAHYHTHP